MDPKDEGEDMIISVASGKGGTGKTTVAVSLAISASAHGDVQLIDCDVEEPNSHIFLRPEITSQEPVGTLIPEVDEGKCTGCGRCQEVCAFNAIVVLGKSVLTFQELCHGCGACAFFCPEDAITEVEREIGLIRSGNAGDIGFVDGILNVGEAMATPLIRAVKRRIDSSKLVIIDAPPGTSCPVIESVKGSSYSILVTEPTPFGLNDLVLAVEVLRKLDIPFGVVINRSDVGDDRVDRYCHEEGIPVLMRLPMDRRIAEAYSAGLPIVEAIPEYRKAFSDLLFNIRSEVKPAEV